MGPGKRAVARILTALGAFAFAVTSVQASAVQEDKVPCPGPENIATPEAVPTPPGEPAPFFWPSPPPRESVPVLPQTMGFVGWPEFRARLVADLYRRSGWNLAADVGEALLKGPELLMDATFSRLGTLSGRPSIRTSEDEESRSITERILEIRFEQRNQRILTVFLQQWTASEQRYLRAIEDSRANTFGFQNRTEDADLDQLALDQRKVFWDALRRTYLARYKVKSEDQITNEAWYFDRWTGIDFAVLPPFLGAYLYYRGLDKRISMGATALRIEFEPVSQLVERRRDQTAAVALEWTVKGIPVGVIVTSGRYNGRFELDFVGIGTSIGAARSAVQGEYASLRR